MASGPRIEVNTPVSQRDEQRIIQEEKTWTGPRLTALCLVVMAIALTFLYWAARDIPSPHPQPYFPWLGPDWR
jgi:hypothetical protein